MVRFSYIIMILALVSTSGYARELVVSSKGPYTTCRSAIDAAQRGDVVSIQPGLYRESQIIVKVPLQIKGAKGAVIDGTNKRGSLIVIESDSVSIRGLEFHNVPLSYVDDNAAIKVENASHIEITNCTMVNAFFGIHMSKSSNCRIANNRMTANRGSESNSGNGVHCWTCRDVTVEGNRIEGHRDGIYFEFMHQGNVVRNFSKDNLRYGLHFMFSDSCSYSNNDFVHNGAGVAVMYTRFVQMFNNRFVDNWGPTSYGLLLKEIFDSHLKGNTFTKNTVGIHCEGANRILFEYNSFTNNGYAMRVLANCDLNTIRDNVFEGNTFDVTTNSKSSVNHFTRNYWSSYDGYDLNKDGYGDVPHHPVRLYSLLVEQMPSSVILMHTPFINILDLAERIIPTVTPETLVDAQPRMTPTMR